MKTEFDAVAQKLKDFLGVTLTPEQDEIIKEKTSFKSIKKNDAVNKRYEIPHTPSDEGPSFIRKGIVGDWKTHFDNKTNAEWDEWIAKELKGTDFKMVFE